MRFSRLAICCAALAVVSGILTTSQAQTGFAGGVPWQVGDIIACFGSGTCNAIRIESGTPVLLDQFSDSLLGDTRGLWINNTLHALVTDNAGGSQSDVVVFSIASVNPSTGTAVAHAPASTFNPSPNNAQAIVVNNAGQIFVGNAGSGLTPTPTIVELNPDGTLASAASVPPLAMPSNPLTLPGNCTDVKGQLLSMDLSKDGSALYLTSTQQSFSTSIATPNGGSIQKLTLASGTCAPFASFGNGVALNGIQDVPPNALPTGASACNGSSCPTDETILVVAEGFLDSDGGDEPGEGIPNRANDTNICTNAVNSPLVSCALLLDTGGGPGLAAPQWVTDNAYASNNTVLDPSLHVQKVISAATGTSGISVNDATYPTWNDSGGMTIDGLRWTLKTPGGRKNSFPDWAPNTTYCAPAAHACPAGSVAPFFQVPNSVTVGKNDIWQAVVFGKSGGSRPTFYVGGVPAPQPVLDNTVTWQDQGTSVVARYPINGVSTIQALSLDPLVTDCTTDCNSLPLPPATTSNFWLGDNSSANFYEVNFGGNVTSFNANANCSSDPGCTTFGSIHALRIYGAEGANQPDLTKLFTTASFAASPNSQKVQFPLPTNATDTNSMTVALFPTTASAIPLSIFASQLPKAASLANGGNNSGATDPPGSFPCEPTTSVKTDCILWKIDANPASSTNLATKFSTVNTTAPTIDTNTDVFVDENYDVTTFIGNFDPGGTRLSVHSLNEVFTGTNSGSCVYTSPAPKCFQSPGNLTFKFSCPTFSGDVSTLRPVLTLVTPPPGTPGVVPQPIVPLVPTGSNPPNYSFNGSRWIFNWQTQNGVIRATTVDLSHQIQTFYEDFSVEKTCPSSVTITAINPTSGTVGGGTPFTIVGTGFAQGATVTFGGNAATSVTVASNGKSITGTTPSSANVGLVDVAVTNPDTTGQTLFDGFTYTTP